MSLQSQTQNDTDVVLVSGLRLRVAQRVTIVSSTITHLGFYIKKSTVGGTPAATGNVTFTIRKVSDDSLVASKVWGDVSALSTDLAWETVAFDSPVSVNEEVRFCCEFSGGGYTSGSNYSGMILRYMASNVAASENMCWMNVSTWIQTPTTYDATYYFVYTSNALLTVNTQAMTNITESTATGNGSIAVFGSDGAVTQYGHCWNTSTDPTTANSKTTLGAKTTVGLFTSGLTGLTPGTTYYVRAYATDSVDTYYGVNVDFVAGEGIPIGTPLAGNIAVIGEYICYISYSGKRRKLPLGVEY